MEHVKSVLNILELLQMDSNVDPTSVIPCPSSLKMEHVRNVMITPKSKVTEKNVRLTSVMTDRSFMLMGHVILVHLSLRYHRIRKNANPYSALIGKSNNQMVYAKIVMIMREHRIKVKIVDQIFVRNCSS